jgi:hypothetical protein
MTVKRVLGVLAGLGALAFVGSLKPWKRGAHKLENAQGIGPTHVAGVPRGEERVLKAGREELTSVAGRIAGSVDPQ